MRKMLSICCVALGAILLTHCSHNVDQNVHNQDSTIITPANWSHVQIDDDTSAYVIPSPEDTRLANMNLIQTMRAANLNDFAASALIDLQTHVHDFAMTADDVAFFVNDLPVIRREFTTAVEQDPLHVVQYYMQSSDGIAVATYVGDKEQFERDIAAVERVIQTYDGTSDTAYNNWWLNKAHAQNPRQKAAEELNNEIGKALEGFYTGLRGWLKGFGEDTKQKKPIPPRTDSSFTDSDLVLYAGLKEVDPHQYLEYIFDYPAGFGNVLIEWKVRGNAKLISAIRIKNSYWLKISAGEPGTFTIDATVYLSEFSTKTYKRTSWTVPKSWLIKVRSKEPPKCPDGQMTFNVCYQICNEGLDCTLRSKRSDGISCYSCDKPTCKKGTSEEAQCKASCDGTCEFSYARERDKALCYTCKPKPEEYAQCDRPAMSYDHCDQVCGIYGYCGFAYKTTAGESCYTCHTCQAPQQSIGACGETCSGTCEKVDSGIPSLFCYLCNKDKSPCPDGQFSNYSACADVCASGRDCREAGRSSDGIRTCYTCEKQVEHCTDGLLPYTACQKSCANKCQFVSLSKIDRGVQCFRCPETKGSCPKGTGDTKDFCKTCSGTCAQSRIEGKLCYTCSGQLLHCPTGSFTSCDTKQCPLGCDRVPNIDQECYTCKRAVDGAVMKRIDPPELCITPDGKSVDCKTGKPF